MTLAEQFDHLYKVYGPRNRHHLPDLVRRVGFLILAVGDLQDAVRKHRGHDAMRIALARIFSRIVCVADYLGRLKVAEAMAEKYPMSGCSYCNSTPCVCSEDRRDAQLSEPNQLMLSWSLYQWQEHLDSLYGEKNRAGGIQDIVARLFKECAEVISLAMTAHTKSVEEIEREYALEIADLLAWTIAVANYFHVDLELAVGDRFGRGCGTCGKRVCECGAFSMQQVDWPSVLADRG